MRPRLAAKPQCMRQFMERRAFQQFVVGSLRRIWAKVYLAKDRSIVLIPAACRGISLSARIRTDANFRVICRHNDGKIGVPQAGSFRSSRAAYAYVVHVASIARFEGCMMFSLLK